MIGRSLLVRLGILAGVLIVLALASGGAALTWLFEREVERRAVYDLTQHLQTIAAQVRIDGDRPVLDATPADPRFNEPYSGLYWQIETSSGERLRSRSLWDFSLPVGQLPSTPAVSSATLAGPDSAVLIAASRRLVLQAGSQTAGVVVTVALDRRDIAAARHEFLRVLVPSLLVLAASLIAAMAAFLRAALRPFRTLGAGLKAVHGGATRTLPGRFPDEVQPVVDDLNRLIAFQDAAVAEARAHAGDLAHGLKTPLAILEAVTRDAAEQGRDELANEIGEQVRAMDSSVRRALARARAGLVGRLGHRPIPVRPAMTRIVDAMRKLTRSRDLQWHVQIHGDPIFRGDAGDLTEMLGNVLDNAAKWARTEVRITATAENGQLQLVVEDDGPGIPDTKIELVERGRRWDEAVAGSGFGLAITRDLAAAYSGMVTLERARSGGLRVSLVFSDMPAVIPPKGNSGSDPGIPETA